MTSLAPYPKYKPSGIEWLGDIPSHWEVRRLKQVATFAYGNSLPSEARRDGEVFVYGSNGVVGKHSDPNTLNPVIIVGRKGSYGRLNWSDASVFAIDTTYFVDQRSTTQNLRWLFYVMGTLDLDQNSRDSAVPGLSRFDAYESILAFPPLHEQRAIAAFLDRKDAEITRFIASRRRMIALLEEKKQAIINQAVTKGLDLSALMKNSGVEWLCEIPAHWTTTTLSRIVGTPITGQTPPSENRAYYGDQEQVRWFGPVDLRGEFEVEESLRSISKIAIEEKVARLIHAPAVIVSIIGSPGVARLVPSGTFATNQQLVALPTSKQCNPKYITYGLRILAPMLAASSSTSTIPILSVGVIRRVILPFPPIEEQHAIVEYLDRIDRTIAQQRSRIEREIELMQEYRTRLISDVVTGKVRVS